MPRKKKRTLIGPHRCKCGRLLFNDKNQVVNVFIRRGDVCCDLCKANVLKSISGGKHAHPKLDRRAGKLITKYYIQDNPEEVAKDKEENQ